MKQSNESIEARERQWDDQWPATSTPEAEAHGDELADQDEQISFPGSVGTVDPIHAMSDAEPYMPPIDPPVLPGGDEGVVIGDGFGIPSDEEELEASHRDGDEAIRDRAIRALRRDSLTSHYDLKVRVRHGVVRLTGRVPTIDDGDYAANVLSNIPGVEDVEDETTLDPSLA